jgi:Tol biopolymer transport system component
MEKYTKILITLMLLGSSPLFNGCKIENPQPTQKLEVPQPTQLLEVPHQDRWGIYALDLDTQATALIYSSSDELTTLRLDDVSNRFVFSQQVGGDGYEYDEIFTIGIDGQDLQQLTDNDRWDIYPTWSPNGSKIAFLSMRDANLDIYIMNSDGSEQELLFDSDSHDADIHWVGDQIAFTSQSQIWIMNEDGTNAHPLTDPPKRGEWGNANLPFGDYDPRIHPHSTHVLFSRLVDDHSSYGNYDLLLANIDGSNPVPLTENSYAQGLASWAPSGEKILFIVAAIDDAGKYDLYLMNADGSNLENITPAYYPPAFLCHFAIFSPDETKIYFIGEWWAEK